MQSSVNLRVAASFLTAWWLERRNDNEELRSDESVGTRMKDDMTAMEGDQHEYIESEGGTISSDNDIKSVVGIARQPSSGIGRKDCIRIGRLRVRIVMLFTQEPP